MGKLFGDRQYQSFLLFDVVASPFDGLCTVTRIVSYQGNESRSSFWELLDSMTGGRARALRAELRRFNTDFRTIK